MNNRRDIAELKRNSDIVDIVGRHVSLKKRGSEYYGICPFHDDTTNSLQVNQTKQIFKCFACGAGTDSLDFLTRLGHSYKEALDEIAGDTNTSAVNVQRTKVAPRPKAIEWTQIVPAPTPEAINHYKHGAPSKWWAYLTADNQLIGYVCRFDIEDGSKEVIPYTYRTDGNRSEWRWQGFDKPRPLFNLHLLTAHPDASVLIVEGEKTAEAAQAQFPDFKTVVTTWPGGSMAINHIDWTPLKGRKIVTWPDNDVQGLSAMLHIRHVLGEGLKLNRIIPLDTTLPKGWDGADKEWAPGEMRQFLIDRMINEIPANAGENLWRINQVDRSSEYEFGLKDGQWHFAKIAAPEPPPAPEPAPEQIEQAPWEGTVDDIPEIETGEEDYSFRFLGFTKEGDNIKHHFFSLKSQTVLTLSATSMSIANLMQLAPLTYWEMNFQGSKGFSINNAVNWIVNTSLDKGMFDSSNVRGRGAWADGKETVIHAGDHLIVNGKSMSLRAHGGRYVYEAGQRLDLDISNPLTNPEANRLIEITNLMNWERDISSYLLAGWCIVAPFCGALKWRPHIWLTGAAGTGKSWVFKNIVRKLMEGMALAVQSETSEAGLRQRLEHDALPIVFDEAEGEDKKAQERMQSVLGLMRAASSDDGGMITKGSAGGSAVSYKIRSCFAFASISVQVAQQSDRTRVTVLGLKKAEPETGAKRWDELQAKYLEIMTDDYIQRLQARTVMLLPTILHNTKVFAAAAASVIGEQRAGDQLGALLAGAYSLFNAKEITLDEAKEWLRTKDWSEEKSLDKTRDEVSLLAHIMEQMSVVETMNARYERNIGELVAIASGQLTDHIMQIEAQSRLKRVGLKVEDNYLVISNTADWLKGKLANTPWSKNHNKILMRLEGAVGMETTRFGSGIQTRAVGIPLRVIFDTTKDTQLPTDMPW